MMGVSSRQETAMSPVTVIDISDPAVLARLAAADGPVIFRGPDGRCVRMAELVPPGQLPAGVRSPISDEEFEQRRRLPNSGVTLTEFWEQVERGEWR
jgi:hypothetical protein